MVKNIYLIWISNFFMFPIFIIIKLNEYLRGQKEFNVSVENVMVNWNVIKPLYNNMLRIVYMLQTKYFFREIRQIYDL